jgi:carboxyl-terminal processing protease
MAALAEPFALAVDRFRSADGLVIDLRGNFGGLVDMMRGIAGHLVAEPVVLGRMRTRATELEFRANPRRVMSDGRRVTPYAGRLALLVDDLTASASECFAAALQSLGRARVFGTPTMGQALPALTKSLPNGDVLMYVVGDFVTGTGQRVERDGVVPDEIVSLDAASLSAGRDALSGAARWLDSAAAP